MCARKATDITTITDTTGVKAARPKARKVKVAARSRVEVGDIENTYRDKKVLVTGGAGFVGSHLVESLVAAGARVRVVDDLSSGSEENIQSVRDRIEFVAGDVRDADLLRSLVSGCSVVFHLAAIPSVDESMRDPVGTTEVNLMASIRLFELCGELGVGRVVFA
ncbi:MAG TPA: SDR family NAD(P)-dependent oxidoreductase, partial [Proteobacteria bacterium]|nr:SDR family NAD(P)-dependent oxidoreductase [Pseudomonadota bacterium]